MKAPSSTALGLSFALLVWLLSLLIWLTWTPFLFHGGVAAFSEVISSPPSKPLEVATNVVLFVPLGLLMIGVDPGTRKMPFWAVVVAGAVSTTIEVGQLWLGARSSSVYDVVLNVVGALLGLWIARHLIRAGLTRASIVGLTGTHVYAAVLIYFLVMASYLGESHRLVGWSPEHEILRGDESGGGREYRGLVLEAKICAGSGPGEICAEEGASRETRRRLVERALESQRFALNATVRSASDLHTGPTRIISFSRGPLRRNVTLGQQGDSLVLRIRTPYGGPNGGNLEFYLPDAVPVGIEARVSARYSRGSVVLRAQHGTEVKSRTASYPLFIWAEIMTWSVREYIPDQIALSAFASLIVLFFPLGLLSDLRRGHLNWLLGSLAAVAIFLVISNRMAVPFHLDWCGGAVAVSLAGWATARAGRRIGNRISSITIQIGGESSSVE